MQIIVQAKRMQKEAKGNESMVKERVIGAKAEKDSMAKERAIGGKGGKGFGGKSAAVKGNGKGKGGKKGGKGAHEFSYGNEWDWWGQQSQWPGGDWNGFN